MHCIAVKAVRRPLPVVANAFHRFRPSREFRKMLVRFSTSKKPGLLIDTEIKQTDLLREVNSEKKGWHFKLKLNQNYRGIWSCTFLGIWNGLKGTNTSCESRVIFSHQICSLFSELSKLLHIKLAFSLESTIKNNEYSIELKKVHWFQPKRGGLSPLSQEPLVVPCFDTTEQ